MFAFRFLSSKTNNSVRSTHLLDEQNLNSGIKNARKFSDYVFPKGNVNYNMEENDKAVNEYLKMKNIMTNIGQIDSEEIKTNNKNINLNIKKVNNLNNLNNQNNLNNKNKLNENNDMDDIQLFSDSHFEHHGKVDARNFLTPSAPYLAIAGDLGNPYMANYKSFLEQVSCMFEKVFYVSGNHEYYSLDDSKRSMKNIDHDIQKICDDSNVIYLNNKSYNINDKVSIVGTTLWSFIPDYLYDYMSRGMTDYRVIYSEEGVLISPQYTSQLFLNNLQFIQNEINILKNNKDENKGVKDIIVLSHHLPSFGMVHSRYVGQNINHAFASNVPKELLEQINVWICGHTHKSMTCSIGSGICINNPLGSKRAFNPDYNFIKTIPIKKIM